MKVANPMTVKLAGLMLMLAAPLAFGTAALAEVTITTTIEESGAGSEAPSEPAEEEDVRDVSEETCEELNESITSVSRC